MMFGHEVAEAETTCKSVLMNNLGLARPCEVRHHIDCPREIDRQHRWQATFCLWQREPEMHRIAFDSESLATGVETKVDSYRNAYIDIAHRRAGVDFIFDVDTSSFRRLSWRL